jgi:tetratricopeptide (TPR) repeat protein
MYKKGISLTVLILFFLYIYFNQAINFKIGEILFLNFNQNKIAIYFLENFSLQDNNSNKNFGFTNLYLLGRIYFVEGNLEKSADYYTKNILINPGHKESYYGRGLSYGFMGKYFINNAKADFSKYIELEQEEFSRTGRHAYGAWAGYNDLAWIYFLEGDFKKSEEVARDAIEFSLNNPWLLNTLGASLASQNKCDEAPMYLKMAEESINQVTIEEFGQAYSGDSKSIWPLGKEQLKNSILENQKICSPNN